MRFEFATVGRILFGPGTLKEFPPLAPTFGKRALLVSGRSMELNKSLVQQLEGHGMSVSVFAVEHEPTVQLVRQGLAIARQTQCDCVIALGGGSAIDAGKAIAVLLTNPGDVLDYLEVVGEGKSITQPGVPLITIPTTAGTGAEVTRNAVLLVPEERVKVSLRSPHLLARLAVVDAELTYSLPPDVTASTGMDALVQLIEPFLSPRATPITDALCREAIPRAAQALPRAYGDGQDSRAREDLSLASLFSGLALANAGLGAVHGFASVIGGLVSAAHGAICARLLSPVMAANYRALQERDAESPILTRFDEVARLVTGAASARAADGIAWLADLCTALAIPRLSDVGLTRGDFPWVVEHTQSASSTKANPIRLTTEELMEILEAAY